MILDIPEIEKIINYSFNDKMLLRKCFVHASYGYEHKEEDNDKLEFFGDAILQFVVTEYLYKNSSGDEGDLTEIRKEIVSKMPLLKEIKRLKLDGFILLGKGQARSKKNDEKLYSSLYEALLGGIYLDGGIKEAKKFILNTLIKTYEKTKKQKKSLADKINKDSKSALQEYVQKLKLGSISYEVLSKTGPDHLPFFRVAVLLNNSKLGEGDGGSKKSAEAEAATKALKKLKQRN